MAGAFSSAFSSAFDIDAAAGAAIARPYPYSLYRRKKKPQTAWLEGTKPAVIPPVKKPVKVKLPKSGPALLAPLPEPKRKPRQRIVQIAPVELPSVASVRMAAREMETDRAVIRAEAGFPTVESVLRVGEQGRDRGRFRVIVSGLSYDDDDIEVLAIALGVYAEELAPEEPIRRRRRR